MNIEKYKKDVEHLIDDGTLLLWAIQRESHQEDFDKLYKKEFGKKFEDLVKKIPRFANKYQQWYSESLALLKLLLPDRFSDFVKLYEKPKNRKSIEYGNYVIEDCLQSLIVTTSFGDRKVGPEAAISQFEQQLNIVKSIQKRFESSLFDILHLVQADVFDNELDVAEELLKKGFTRAAGAVAGVVLEGHLKTVCDSHNVKITKSNPTISDFNDALKNADVIEVPDWRRIQHLGDLRNLCDHKKKTEPKKEEIEDLIAGVKKVMKNIF